MGNYTGQHVNHSDCNCGSCNQCIEATQGILNTIQLSKVCVDLIIPAGAYYVYVTNFGIVDLQQNNGNGDELFRCAEVLHLVHQYNEITKRQEFTPEQKIIMDEAMNGWYRIRVAYPSGEVGRAAIENIKSQLIS